MKFLLICISVFISSTAFSQTACIDYDGDGWGWDGERSCKVGVSTPAVTAPSQPTQSTSNAECVDTDGDGWGWDGEKSCEVGATTPVVTAPSQPTQPSQPSNPTSSTAECIDTDGDGYGWDGERSCKIGDSNPVVTTPSQPNTPSNPNNSAECIDHDGDGYGWDGERSCKIGGSNPVVTTPNQPSNNLVINNSNCSSLNGKNLRNEVTDVILTAGQSNAAGNHTRYQPNSNSQDRISNNLIVWTTSNRWEIPDPTSQTWHTYTNDRGETSRFPRNTNHPALQIGNAIAKSDPCRVVAIIATAAPGQPIRIWNNNENNYFSSIDNKVKNALNQLPGKNRVDMIWWMQGEADNDPDANRYLGKVNNLINKFRALNWYGADKYFVANETGWFPFVNNALKNLRTNSDQNTDFSRGEDRPSDPFPSLASEVNNKTHFNEISLRKIGEIVKNKYINKFPRN